MVDYRRCGQCERLAPDEPGLGTPAVVDPARLEGVWKDQRGGELAIGNDGRYKADDLVTRTLWDVDDSSNPSVVEQVVFYRIGRVRPLRT